MGLIYCKWKVDHETPADIKKKAVNDVIEALDMRGVTMSELLGKGGGKRMAEAREVVSVILTERFGIESSFAATSGGFMSVTDMENLIGIKRETIIYSRKRWIEKHQEDCPGLPLQTRSIEQRKAG